MPPFSLTNYPAILHPLLETDHLPDLGPGKPNEAVRPLLASLKRESLFTEVRDQAMADCCLSGLWLLHDFLEESHTLSQEIETSTGSYWHAIMHRREPDPGNSKYWWRRVGKHSVLNLLVEQAPALGYRFSDPYAFVDFVEQVRDIGSAEEETAKRIQRLEWELLFDYCWQAAGGASPSRRS